MTNGSSSSLSELCFLEGLNMNISRTIGEMPSQCGAMETKRIGLIPDMFDASVSIFLKKIGMQVHQSFYRLKVGGSETLTTLLHFSLQIFSASAKNILILIILIRLESVSSPKPHHDQYGHRQKTKYNCFLFL